MSPFRKEFGGPRQIVEEVAAELGCRCVRADDIHKPGVIHADIWEHVQRAGAVVADITDLNPNVMLEVGVAAAVKEQFRLILMIRSDAAETVPFDLAPFRYIGYEDSLAGSGKLRERLRESLKFALSEAGAMSFISVRMGDWDKADHDYWLLASPETLARARGFSRIAAAGPDILAYLLASAIQHGSDVEFWARLNEANPKAAEVLVELLLGPWARPQFRAAYAAQFLKPDLRQRAVEEAQVHSSHSLVARLVDAIQKESVVALVSESGDSLLNESDRYELLQNFRKRIRVRISTPTE
jgi:hypothetical protein